VRLAVVIIALAAMAVTLVHVRRAEITARHQIEQLNLQRRQLRRTLWDQQIALGRLTNPQAVKDRGGEMGLGLVEPRPSQNSGHAGLVPRATGR
jgi:hypothetical protein